MRLSFFEHRFLGYARIRDSPSLLMMGSIAPIEQMVLATLTDRGYGIFQFGRLVPESLRWLLADEAYPSVFRILVNHLIIFIPHADFQSLRGSASVFCLPPQCIYASDLQNYCQGSQIPNPYKYNDLGRSDLGTEFPLPRKIARSEQKWAK